MKKSRNGLILDDISKCSEELARAKPAKNPPISIEKPILFGNSYHNKKPSQRT